MVKQDDFYKDLSRGKRGEKLMFDALTARGHTVEDLRDNAEARSKDIDFRVFNKNSSTMTTLEVKTDERSEETGNLFIEYSNTNNRSHNYKGWYYYCEAEYIAFIQEHNHKAHIVLMEELRENIKKTGYRTASSYNACGFLMPITKLETLGSYQCIAI